MLQTTYIPPLPLRTYVSHVWTLRSEIGPAAKREMLIPNGRPGLVFCLGQPCIRTDVSTGQSYQGRSLYYSVATHPFAIEQHGAAWYIGVELQPYGLAAFLQGQHAANSVGSLEEVFGKDTLHTFVQTLQNQRSPAEAAEQTICFLADRLRPLPAQALARLEAATTHIQTHKGDVSTTALAQQLHISTSTLRRLFRQYIGVSPEQFTQVIRYAAFVDSLLSTTQAPNLLAALHGYYDEAHASKDFKKYTGLSKTQFLHVCDNLARMMRQND